VDALLPKYIRSMLKWPHDVPVRGAKLSGILLEQVELISIIGIGLDVLHAPAFAGYKTTLIAASGGIASVGGARNILLDRPGHRLDAWQQDGFAPTREAWLEHAHPNGATPRVTVSGQKIKGVSPGWMPMVPCCCTPSGDGSGSSRGTSLWGRRPHKPPP